MQDAMLGRNTAHVISEGTHSDDIANFSTLLELEFTFLCYGRGKAIISSRIANNLLAITAMKADNN
jgi:hypothetical protein